MVSRRSFKEMKLIVDDRVPYPLIDYVGRPIKEYVLHIPMPEKLVPYDLKGNKVIALRVFKACVAHEAGHAYLTDPLIYERWRYKKDEKISGFSANLLEDFRVENFLSSKWAGLGGDLVLANVVAYMRSRPVDEFDNALKRIMAAIVSKVFVKCVKGSLSKREEKTLQEISEILERVKWNSRPEALVSAADNIYKKVSRYGSSDVIRVYPTAPHRDGKPSSEFYQSAVLSPGRNAQEVVEGMMKELSLNKLSKKVFSKNAFSEASFVFHHESTFRKKEKDMLKVYLKNKFNLLGVYFPPNDYSEFLRLRERVLPLTRRIGSMIAQVKTEYEEESHQRSGLIDLNEAVQAVASQTSRSDVFRQMQRTASSSAWAILIDNSESLSTFKVTLKEVLICLAEVANMLMSSASWALYTFNDCLSILKDFDEKYDRRVHYRLGGLTTGGPTYLPDALNVVYRRLLMLPQNYKVMIVITDGQPHGYEGIEKETAETVKTIQRSGVTLIAIGLKSNKVKRYFSDFCYVNSFEDLAKNFTRLYYSLSQWI